MDSLRYTDYDVAVFLEGSMNFLEKFFYIEIGFRKINEKRIVSNIFPGKGSSSGEPASVTSHDLDDSDGFFLIDAGVQGDLTDGGDVYKRQGCFLAGCCYGKETASVFSVIFKNSEYAPTHVADVYKRQINPRSPGCLRREFDYEQKAVYGTA